MNWLPVKSGRVHSVAYDPLSRQMHVKFHGGQVYAYLNVSSLDHARFIRSDSIGRALNELAKSKTFHRV